MDMIPAPDLQPLTPVSNLEYCAQVQRTVSELLSGRPFDLTSDLEIIKGLDVEYLDYVLKRPSFKAQYELDSRRSKHINMFATLMSIATDMPYIQPSVLESKNKASLKPLCIKLSYTVGIEIASRLTGVGHSTISNWLYEDAGNDLGIKQNFMSTIAGKSMHIVDAYMSRLLEKRLIDNASIKDIKETLTLMTDVSKSLSSGEWSTVKDKNAAAGNASSGGNIGNVINVIINDKEMHDSAMNNIMQKMGLISAPISVEGPAEQIAYHGHGDVIEGDYSEISDNNAQEKDFDNSASVADALAMIVEQHAEEANFIEDDSTID